MSSFLLRLQGEGQGIDATLRRPHSLARPGWSGGGGGGGDHAVRGERPGAGVVIAEYRGRRDASVGARGPTFGLKPAMRAARLSPIDAIHHE